MVSWFKNEYIVTNTGALIVYIAGAIISIGVNSSDHFFIPLWLPLAFSTGYLLTKGINVLWGIGVGSFLTHLVIISQFNSSIVFIISFTFLLSSLDLLYAYLFFLIHNNWYTKFGKKLGSLRFNLSILSATVISIPIVLGQLFLLIELNLSGLSFNSFYTVYLANALPLLVFTPLFITWYKKFFEPPFLSAKEVVVYFSLVVITLLTIITNYLNVFPSFSGVMRTLSFIIPSFFIIYNATNFSNKILFSSLAFLSITFALILSSFSLHTANYDLQFDSLLLVFLLAIVGFYLKCRFNNQKPLSINTDLESKVDDADEEALRQLLEYKDLSTKLFEEVERRGLAEKELAQSRGLLTEAQDFSGISTWEYNVLKDRFRWVSTQANAIPFAFNLESATLKSVATKLHPDDLKKIIELKKSMLRESKNFEAELRILNDSGDYNYYLIRGRSILEKNRVERVLGMIMDISERKKAEQVLIEKEEKYRALFDSNIDPVCVIDAISLEIKDVNPAFENLYGFNRSEIIEKSYLTLSAQPMETKAAIAFGRQQGYYKVLHRTHQKKNGEKFFIEANLMSHLVDGKEMLFIITQDITRRKEAENSLTEREQKYRAFFESDLIGMAEISIAKEFLSFNERLTHILEYSEKELKTLSWDLVTHPEDLAKENRLFNQILTHETTGYSIEKRLISKSSEVISCKVSLKSIKNSQGTISHLIVLVDDISDRKRIENELQESKAKLSQSQSVAKLGTIRFFTGENYVTLSNEAYEILGFGANRPIVSRKEIFKLILPGGQTKLEEQICDLENGSKLLGDFEQTVMTPKGEVRYILTNFGVSQNNDLKVTEVLVTMADITRIKKAEMALQEANTLKDQLFSIIGHDLRSPIGSISQLAKLLEDGWGTYDEESLKRVLNTITNTSIETFKLLESLLEWAKAQRTENFAPAKTNLSSLIEEVVSLKKSVADSKNIDLQVNLLPTAVVMVDGDMIKTALRNIINNSIKFTPNTGSIVVNTEEDNNNYIVSVTDSGVGISEENLEKIFDNSVSFSTKGTDDEKGTGLGLKLVKKFVERNGGQISVESILGQGTKFSFSLPKYFE